MRRCDDDGIFSISRYLATVRRARSMPSWEMIFEIASSLSGFPGTSLEIIFFTIFRTDAADALMSESRDVIFTLKNDFNGIQPRGVEISKPVVTRLTVLSCIPTA